MNHMHKNPPNKQKSIAFYTHKGGVGKTTTLIHVAYLVARTGKRVCVVDCDPQLNATLFLLQNAANHGEGPSIEEWYERIFDHREPRNLKNYWDSHRLSKPDHPDELVKVENNLFLLPGHQLLSEVEVNLTMAVAQSYQFGNPVLYHSFRAMLDLLCEKNNIDVFLLDLGPSPSMMNQNIILSSTHFITPCNPDFFSKLTLRAMDHVISTWVEAHLPYIGERRPKFLGLVINECQSYRKESSSPACPVVSKATTTTTTTTATATTTTTTKRDESNATEHFKQELTALLQKTLLRRDVVINGTIKRDIVLLDHDYTILQVPDMHTINSVAQECCCPVMDLQNYHYTKVMGYNKSSTQKAMEMRVVVAYMDIADMILATCFRK